MPLQKRGRGNAATKKVEATPLHNGQHRSICDGLPFSGFIVFILSVSLSISEVSKDIMTSVTRKSEIIRGKMKGNKTNYERKNAEEPTLWTSLSAAILVLISLGIVLVAMRNTITM